MAAIRVFATAVGGGGVDEAGRERLEHRLHESGAARHVERVAEEEPALLDEALDDGERLGLAGVGVAHEQAYLAVVCAGRARNELVARRRRQIVVAADEVVEYDLAEGHAHVVVEHGSVEEAAAVGVRPRRRVHVHVRAQLAVGRVVALRSKQRVV